MGRIILDSRLALLLMGQILFSCSWVFSGFKFIFSNPKQIRGEFRYCYSRPVLIIF